MMPFAPDHSRLTERWFNRLIVGAVVIGFAALIAAGASAMLSVFQNQRHTFWVNHTYQVERQVSLFRVLLERSEAARRGMLLSDDPHIVATFVDSTDRLRPAFDEIGRLTADNPVQRANVSRARSVLDREIALLRGSYLLVEAGQRPHAADTFRATRTIGLVRVLRAEAQRMLDEEDRLLRLRNAAQQRSLRDFVVILALAGVLLLAVGIGSVWVILRYTRELARSRNALRALNDDLEGAVQVRTTDLRRANEEIQRFAYIVSHDLRSPLVNVMGFTAELETATKVLGQLIDRAEAEAPRIVSRDAQMAVREDLPEAIGFIRTSTERMDRLINAILRLSREGRRPIMPEPIDLDALTHAVVDSQRHRADELGAAVAVQPNLPGIVSDRLAVEQILANIVENALKYLKPGRPGRIELTARVEGSRTAIAIADNGRGIDPRDHERIFDLFRRSGVQDQPGEGIGLAHTRALAYRLGGTITVESVLGEGATFRLVLPTRFAGEQGS